MDEAREFSPEPVEVVVGLLSGQIKRGRLRRFDPSSAVVELALRQRGEQCDVFVGESTVRYLAPVWDDFEARAELAPDADWTTFFSTLENRGRARIEVVSAVPGAPGKPCATLISRFVAKRRDVVSSH